MDLFSAKLYVKEGVFRTGRMSRLTGPKRRARDVCAADGDDDDDDKEDEEMEEEKDDVTENEEVKKRTRTRGWKRRKRIND